MDIKVQNITINPNEIRDVIASLDAAIERNQKLKALCEEILAVQSGGAPARRGRKAAAAPAATARPRGRGRRPRGEKTLRQMIVEVLERSGKPLGAGALRDAVLAAGYQTTAKPQSFYTAVYNTATKEPTVLKGGDGFYVGAASGESAAPAKKTKKKRGRPRGRGAARRRSKKS